MQFTILRYVHDTLRDEPINVGLIATYQDRRLWRVINPEEDPREMELEVGTLELFIESWFVNSEFTIQQLCDKGFWGVLRFYQPLAAVCNSDKECDEWLDRFYHEYVHV